MSDNVLGNKLPEESANDGKPPPRGGYDIPDPRDPPPANPELAFDEFDEFDVIIADPGAGVVGGGGNMVKGSIEIVGGGGMKLNPEAASEAEGPNSSFVFLRFLLQDDLK